MVGTRVSRWSGAVVGALVLAVLAPLAPASADPALPYALVDSPAAGSVPAGPVHVTGEGHLDPAGPDTAVALILKVDGTATGDPVDCTTPPATDCTGAFDTGSFAAGSSHDLVIELTTTDG